MLKIVATTSLPVDRLTATDCNADARANIVFCFGPGLGLRTEVKAQAKPKAGSCTAQSCLSTIMIVCTLLFLG